MKVIVLFKNGFEEIEALSPVDVLRRAGIEVSMVGMDEKLVQSSHGITIQMDEVYSDALLNADVVILPGGQPGSNNLRDDERVITLLKKFNEEHKLICAICAAPIVLNKAGLLKDKKFTCYPGCEEGIHGQYQDVLVYEEDNMITARGPAAALQFGYTILEHLGKKSDALKEGMQYPYLYK